MRSRAGLVPLTLSGKHQERLADLSGVALPVTARCNGASFSNYMLVTHRGISGPSILQISSYWQPGDDLRIDLLPGHDALEALQQWQRERPAAELKTVLDGARSWGARAALSEVWAKGGEGGVAVANEVLAVLDEKKAAFKPLYDTGKPIKEKIETIAREIYGAAGVDFSAAAEKNIAQCEAMGLGARVNIPNELRHYQDDRRFLAVQMADAQESRTRLPHDDAELIEQLRAGELVELPALTRDYVLYEVGEDAADDPMAHYDVEKNRDVPLFASPADYEAERSRLEAAAAGPGRSERVRAEGRLRLLREYYDEYQIAPAVRVLTKAIGKKLGPDKGNSKYLYDLFPYGPGKQACKIAGLPKPTGCI